LKALFSTFLLVFLAELGDKTQLATMLMASQGKSFWTVFIGASVALVLSAFIGARLGCYLGESLPQEYIQKGAGAAFIIIGIFMISGKF
jgi:putative Ca2+/H+ antiporter (TMEM165/GDT1 family)